MQIVWMQIMWRPKGNILDLSFSFYLYVVSWAWTQILKNVWQRFYPLRHFSEPLSISWFYLFIL